MKNKPFYVYILTNKNRTVLYTGITNNLSIRLFQHANKLNLKSFTSRYNVFYLIYYETMDEAKQAIEREKEIKNLNRQNKLDLIRSFNPNMDFLNDLFSENL